MEGRRGLLAASCPAADLPQLQLTMQVARAEKSREIQAAERPGGLHGLQTRSSSCQAFGCQLSHCTPGNQPSPPHPRTRNSFTSCILGQPFDVVFQRTRINPSDLLVALLLMLTKPDATPPRSRETRHMCRSCLTYQVLTFHSHVQPPSFWTRHAQHWRDKALHKRMRHPPASYLLRSKHTVEQFSSFPRYLRFQVLF